MRAKTYSKYKVERSIGGREAQKNEDGTPVLSGEPIKTNIRITPEQAELLNEGWDSVEKPLTFYYQEVGDSEAPETLDRDVLKTQADALGIEYAKNIKATKLKELIDNHKSE